MAPLDTGRFIIINSKSKNVVYLADANSCSDLRGDWQQNRPGEIWNIVLLSNGNYTIKNYGYGSYATCEFIAKPAAGNNIVGGNSDHQQQWMIIDQGNSYVICPTTNGHVYWHLADGESGTPITLEPYSQTNKIRWEFIKLEDAEEPGSAVGGETGRVRGNADAPSTVLVPTPVPVPTFVLVRNPVTPSASPLTSESLVMRSIAPGSRYTIRVAETNLYLGVPYWEDRVDSTYKYANSDSWLVTRCGGNWRIQVWRSSQYLSIPKYGAGHVSDNPTELSLTPVGGPNEFRITEVDSGRSWGGLVFEYYE